MIDLALDGDATAPVDATTFAATATGAVRLLLLEVQPLVGDLATRAFYVRGLHLAHSEFRRPEPAASVSLEALLAPLAQDLASRGFAQARRASQALLLSLADLLISLIGIGLTHRMLRSAWSITPELPHEEKS